MKLIEKALWYIALSMLAVLPLTSNAKAVTDDQTCLIYPEGALESVNSHQQTKLLINQLPSELDTTLPVDDLCVWDNKEYTQVSFCACRDTPTPAYNPAYMA